MGAWAPALEGKSECSSLAMDQNKLIYYGPMMDGLAAFATNVARPIVYFT
jgi:hypothetical protein